MGGIPNELSIEKLLQIELTTCKDNLSLPTCHFSSSQNCVKNDKVELSMDTTKANNSCSEDKIDPLLSRPSDGFPNYEEKKKLFHNPCASTSENDKSKIFVNRTGYRHQSSDAICYNPLESLHGSMEMCQPIARRNKKLLTLPILSRRLPSYELHNDEIVFSKKKSYQSPTTQDSLGSPLSTLLTNNLLNLGSNKSSLFTSQPLSFVNESTCTNYDSEKDMDGISAFTGTESVVSCCKSQQHGNNKDEASISHHKKSPWKQSKTSLKPIFFSKFHKENNFHIQKKLSTTDTDTFETTARSFFQKELYLNENLEQLSINSINTKNTQIMEQWCTFDDETCLHDKELSIKRLNRCLNKLEKSKNITQLDIGGTSDMAFTPSYNFTIERHQTCPVIMRKRKRKLFGEMLDTTKSSLASALNLFQKQWGNVFFSNIKNKETSTSMYGLQIMCEASKKLLTLKDNVSSPDEYMPHLNGESHCLIPPDVTECPWACLNRRFQEKMSNSTPEKMMNLLNSQETSTSYVCKNLNKAFPQSCIFENESTKNSLDEMNFFFNLRDFPCKKDTKRITRGHFSYNMHKAKSWQMRVYDFLNKLFTLNYANEGWRKYAKNIWEALFHITPVFVVLVYLLFQRHHDEEKKKKAYTTLISRFGYIADMYMELVEYDPLELSYDNPWLLCRTCRYLESQEDDQSNASYTKRMFKNISFCNTCFSRYKAFCFATMQLKLFLQMYRETFNWNYNESLVLQVLQNNQFIATPVVTTNWSKRNICEPPYAMHFNDTRSTKNETKTLLSTSCDGVVLKEYEKDYFVENINDLYILGPTLGVGAEGHVCLCISCLTVEKYGLNETQIEWDSLVKMSRNAQQKTGKAILYTMKVAEKNNCERNIQQLYEDLKHLKHPNVLRVHAFFQDKKNYYLLTDFLEGKELITYVLSAQCNNYVLRENQCREICFQMLKSLEYIHQHNLIHRDVKLENFVFSDSVRMQTFIQQESFQMQDVIDDTAVQIPRIVLIDFGLMCRTTQACYTRPNGTPLYMAPEVLLESCFPPFMYQTSIDVWAVGIVLYQLLSGKVPFDAKGPLSTIEKIETIEYGNETNSVFELLNSTCDSPDTFSLLRYNNEALSRCHTYQDTPSGRTEQGLLSKNNLTDTTMDASLRTCYASKKPIRLEIFKMKPLCLNQPEWYSISDHAKDLLHQLLTANAKRRITASQALHHPWFSMKKKKI
ncbi:uncharacterized protein LOC128883163 isoform X2 [Hylaeus volcanicus]|uniref:uncharacterized protein LOC128883163 isoform X2 n=1 Tax=Hylaeus volcanicus TaxID=313075 RepID=UPI0023B86074|nr:uncharacterized protein LOC128883163 isoform X2 [Hylaeus volcanicus]